MSIKRVGLIVNPVAGMGGRVGLKGSDGAEILKRARALGATPRAPQRAVEALKRLLPLRDRIEWLTWSGEMGQAEADECGFQARVVGTIARGETTAADTRRAAREFLELGVDLLLFAGGDGTAVDICHSIGDRLTVIGIPAGVKMHSAVFAINPRAAGDLAAAYLRGEAGGVREAEVMDIDEGAFRDDRLAVKLYGYLCVPVEKNLIQNMKEASRGDEEMALEGIAETVIESMNDDEIFVMGPGTTTRAIMTKLGIEGTLLGVDVIFKRRLIAKDANEQQLLALVQNRESKLVITPIGGQGFLFGRGNQQLSASVIRAIGKENLIVVAMPEKISALNARPLWVDTDDEALNNLLAGYVKITTGYHEQIVYRVATIP